MSVHHNIATYLQQSKGIYPLITFRITFGLLLFFGTLRTWSNGWIEKLYLEPNFFFKFYGFHWVHPPEETGIYILFGLITVSSLGIAFGLFYRLSTIIFFLSFTYKELIDATNYLNHYYLVSLLGFLLIFLPANRLFSLDVAWRGLLPKERVPRYCIDIIIAQLTIVYTCAGLAKLNTDWLLHGLPLRIWLPEHRDMPLLGCFFGKEWIAYIFSWGGAIYDLTIAYFLIWSRTRTFAYVLVVVFHGLTYLLFNIGLFPMIMITSTLIYLSEAFHLRLLKRIGFPERKIIKTNLNFQWKQPIVLFFALFLLIQIMLPFRHLLLYDNHLFWSEEGYRFGWRVMLVEKSGQATFTVHDPETGQTAEIRNSQYLTTYQEKQMAIQPDFILQYAHFLKETYQTYYQIENPIVTVDAHVALNGRASKQFIDPTIDLSQQKDTFAPKSWILPFK